MEARIRGCIRDQCRSRDGRCEIASAALRAVARSFTDAIVASGRTAKLPRKIEITLSSSQWCDIDVLQDVLRNLSVPIGAVRLNAMVAELLSEAIAVDSESSATGVDDTAAGASIVSEAASDAGDALPDDTGYLKRLVYELREKNAEQLKTISSLKRARVQMRRRFRAKPTKKARVTMEVVDWRRGAAGRFFHSRWACHGHQKTKQRCVCPATKHGNAA